MTTTGSYVDAEAMKQSMRQWATGVTVVSAAFQGDRHGMTVSSFTSVSLEPPLVLVSLQVDTRTCQLVEASGHFGVTVLDQNQQDLSDRFAGRMPETSDRFADLDHFQLSSGVPFIPGGLAYFDCQVVAAHAAGNHIIFIGQVQTTLSGEVGRPLVYHNRGYRHLA